MPPIDAAYLAHQRARWMRPDAHLFIRPDWRRFVRPGQREDHLFAQYERKYSPEQPRVPAGSRDGGQWTSEGGGGGAKNPTPNPASNQTTTELSAAGHHYIPKGIFKKYPLPAETRAVLNQATTGKLLDPSSNFYDKEHRAYNEAVKEELDRYLRANNIAPDKMTPDQAREVVGRVFMSEDPRIRSFDLRMRTREIRRYIMRRLRGAE